MSNGYILYHGKSLIGNGDIAVIATLESSNIKTGNMVQVWILHQSMDPLDAVQQNDNSAICGNCPLQGYFDPALGRMVNRVCYVNLGQAPKQVWRTYRAGGYPVFKRKLHERYLRGRDIRIGAYGDPAAMPISWVRYLAGVGAGWTGYSHQLFWINQRRASELAKYLMVSCHTPAQHAEALRRGWRPFTAVAEGQEAPEGALECPNYTHGLQCADCQLCRGTSIGAKPIFVRAHAKVGANLPMVQLEQGSQV